MRHHYYWLNQGRLGNLLFQYEAILALTSADDRVYSFHNEVFELIERDPRFVVVAPAGRIAGSIRARLDRVIRWAVHRRLLGLVGVVPLEKSDNFPVESSDVLRCYGKIPSAFAIEGFFQDGERHAIRLRIKAGLKAKAQALLQHATPARVVVAVHIRLTDYKDWTVFGFKDASIPISWYRDRMNECRRRFDSPTFVMFSDDMAAVKQLNLGDDITYFNGSAIDDLTVMAVCDHIIMSPSSFAWWAAFLFPRPDRIFIAPMYWAGFKSKRWYPPTINTSSFEYYEVAGTN